MRGGTGASRRGGPGGVGPGHRRPGGSSGGPAGRARSVGGDGRGSRGVAGDAAGVAAAPRRRPPAGRPGFGRRPAAGRPGGARPDRRVPCADPEAARRGARTEVARRGDTVTRRSNSVDPVSTLWAGYPRGDLVTLAGLDSRVAHAVAVAAVTPRPAVRTDVAAALLAQVRASGTRRSRVGGPGHGVGGGVPGAHQRPAQRVLGRLPHRTPQDRRPENQGGKGFRRRRTASGRPPGGALGGGPGDGGGRVGGPVAARLRRSPRTCRAGPRRNGHPLPAGRRTTAGARRRQRRKRAVQGRGVSDHCDRAISRRPGDALWGCPSLAACG